MNIYIGIDPGQKGAVAIIDSGGDFYIERVSIYDMPLLPNKEVDVREINAILSDNNPKDIYPWFCILEKAQPMPKQGVKSVFNYGVGYGEIKATLKILGIPFIEVAPRVWKKHFSLGKDKKEAVVKTLKLFPQLSMNDFQGPKGGLKDGRAEALLMAEFGRTKR